MHKYSRNNMDITTKIVINFRKYSKIIDKSKTP